jgi:hypothetical protein
MESFKRGTRYVFFGLPLWVRGVVDREDPRFVWLTAETAEYLPDAQLMADYGNKSTSGELLKRPYAVPKDGLAGVMELDW